MRTCRGYQACRPPQAARPRQRRPVRLSAVAQTNRGAYVQAAMAANKLPGIRAALCHDVYSAHQCVEHDNANVFCLGAQIVGDRLALDLLQAYLQAEFSTEEHFRRRVRMLAQLEQDAARELR